MKRADSELIREVDRWCNGKRRVEIRSAIRQCANDMSTPSIKSTFMDVLKKHGRAVTAITLAVKIVNTTTHLRSWSNAWAWDIMNAVPTAVIDIVYNDGLHPLRIVEYAGEFINMNAEDDGR